MAVSHSRAPFIERRVWSIQTFIRSPKIGNTFGAYKDGNSYHNQSFDSLLFCFFFFALYLQCQLLAHYWFGIHIGHSLLILPIAFLFSLMEKSKSFISVTEYFYCPAFDPKYYSIGLPNRMTSAKQMSLCFSSVPFKLNWLKIFQQLYILFIATAACESCGNIQLKLFARAKIPVINLFLDLRKG